MTTLFVAVGVGSNGLVAVERTHDRDGARRGQDLRSAIAGVRNDREREGLRCLAAAAVVLTASLSGAAATGYLYQRFVGVAASVHAQAMEGPDATTTAGSPAPATGRPSGVQYEPASRPLPAEAGLTILVGSYPLSSPDTNGQIAALTAWLERSGFDVYFAQVDLGPHGYWQRVLAGAYTDPDAARRDAERLRSANPSSDARVLTAGEARGTAIAARTDQGTRR